MQSLNLGSRVKIRGTSGTDFDICGVAMTEWHCEWHHESNPLTICFQVATGMVWLSTVKSINGLCVCVLHISLYELTDRSPLLILPKNYLNMVHLTLSTRSFSFILCLKLLVLSLSPFSAYICSTCLFFLQYLIWPFRLFTSKYSSMHSHLIIDVSY